MSRHQSARLPRRLISIAGLASGALLLAACGSSGSTPAGSSPTSPASAASPRTFGANFSGVSGKVTAVSGSGAKVTSSGTTTIVAFASSTRFTKSATGSQSDLSKGDCVMVTSSTARTSATPSATPVTARSVGVTGTSGCSQGGFRGGTAPRGGFGNGTPPSGGFGNGTPFPRPSGSPGTGGFGARGFGGGGFGGGAFGTIASLSTNGFTVKSLFGSGSTITVRTTAATTYTKTETAAIADVTTGRCLSAVGQKTSTGTVDAQTALISSPIKGSCPAARPGGFGGRGFGSGGFGGGGPGATGQGGTNA